MKYHTVMRFVKKSTFFRQINVITKEVAKKELISRKFFERDRVF